MKSLIVTFSGLPGAGKDYLPESIAEALRKEYPEVKVRVPTYMVTRPPRPGEKHEVVSEQEYERRLQAGELFSPAEITSKKEGTYKVGHRKSEIAPREGVSLVNISASLVPKVKEAFSKGQETGVISVFLEVPKPQRFSRIMHREYAWFDPGSVEATVDRSEEEVFFETHREAFDIVLDNSDGSLEKNVRNMSGLILEHLGIRGAHE